MNKDTLSSVQPITFEEILPIWRDKLWPGRVSKIETHSAMTWFSESYPSSSYDMNIFNYPVYFWGIFDNTNQLIAVNSGHLTNDTDFRSRGLWVDPSFRNKGLACELLTATVDQAILTQATLIWSVPRVSAVRAYEKVGFTTIGNIITDGVEFGPNIYCYKAINIR